MSSLKITAKPVADAAQFNGVDSLILMISKCRPAGCKTERRWIHDWIDPLGCEVVGNGNRVLDIGDNPEIIWSCHTDTVHRRGGEQILTSKGAVISAVNSSCLGADDTAGAWLMREMILAKVPGRYIFHRAEEVGCVGSQFLAKNEPWLFEGIKAAIAFDRKGYQDIITHQLSRCCSDTFARSLGKAIGLGYKPDPTGVFTDTAYYTDLVGECTNVSVGYHSAHSSKESLDIGHILNLRNSLLTLDTSILIYEREAGAIDPDDHIYSRYGISGGWGDWCDGSYGGSYNGDYVRDSKSKSVLIDPYDRDDATANGQPVDDYEDYQRSLATTDRRSMLDLIKDHPEAARDLLEHCGCTRHDFLELLF